MKLYFGNMVTIVTTLMIVSLVGFVGYSVSNRSSIIFWGRRSLFVLAYARDMVLCDVRWSDAKDCSYGDRKNDTDVLGVFS